jgi:amino acid adenylation domain-containing protein
MLAAAPAGSHSPGRYDRSATIMSLFRQQVASRGEATALVSGRERIGYRTLERRANRLAHRLRGSGVRPGDAVAVCLDRSTDAVVAYLAVLAAGGVYLPLDPDFPSSRLMRLIEIGRAVMTLTIARHRKLAPWDLARLVCLDDAIELAREADTPPSLDTGPLDPAYIMFTSGSSGAPKGVVVPHRAVVRLVSQTDYVTLGPGDAILSAAPMAFDASTFEIWGALLNGGRLVLAPAGPVAPAELATLAASERVTTLWLTAGLLNRVVDDHPSALAGLRQLLAGGDVLSAAHVNRALALLPEDAVFVNGYGPTEATTFTCAHRMAARTTAPSPVPIGRPIAGSRVYVLDEAGKPLAAGSDGELWIGGDGVALGYVGDERMTAESFRPDPFTEDSSARMYRSGDRARWRSDGALDFLGRMDRQIKIRGFRVEPGEIEDALRHHPSVKDCAVAPATSSRGDRRLVAYVVPRSAANVDDAALRAHVAGSLPTYAVPAGWVRIDALPLTPNGKVDFASLPEAERHRRALDRRGAAAPSDMVERRVIDVWIRVLGSSEIGVDDDFFALGGHSLLAVELFGRIEQAMGVRLPLSAIFEAPTVRGQAALLREAGVNARRPALVPITTTGARPTLFFVSPGDGNPVGYGPLARRLGPDQPFYVLEAHHGERRRTPPRSVEALAAFQLRLLRRQQPNGPYLLGGRCLGALVAFEMARRLSAAGESVPLMLVIDSGGPLWQPRPLADGTPYDEVMHNAFRRGYPDRPVAPLFTAAGTEWLLRWLAEPVMTLQDGLTINRYVDRVYRIRADIRDAFPNLTGADGAAFVDWLWRNGRHHYRLCEALLPQPPPEAATRPAPKLSNKARLGRALRSARGRLLETIETIDHVAGGWREGADARRRARVIEAGRHASATYRPATYRGTVTLVRSDEYTEHGLVDRWHAVAAEVREIHVRGNHRSMLREPDVASFADGVRALVDRVIRGESDQPPDHALDQAPRQ